MRRSEAVAIITGVQRTCAGQWVLSEEQRNTYRSQLAALLSPPNIGGLVQLCRALEALLGTGFANIDTEQTLTTRILSLIFLCQNNCNYDINQIIVTLPWDGNVYPYTCPNCGVTGEIQSPPFPDIQGN